MGNSALSAAQGTAHLPPLFVTELVAKDGEGIVYRIEPSAFVAGVLAVYDKAAASVQDIPQLEKFVMENVFWSDTPMLQTIATHEGVAPDCRAGIVAALETVLPPTEAYKALYDKYLPSVAMDVAEFMATYTSTEKTIQEMQADVRKQQKYIDEIERDIPLNVVLGIFDAKGGSSTLGAGANTGPNEKPQYLLRWLVR